MTSDLREPHIDTACLAQSPGDIHPKANRSVKTQLAVRVRYFLFMIPMNLFMFANTLKFQQVIKNNIFDRHKFPDKR